MNIKKVFKPFINLLDDIKVEKGDQVKQGDVIGKAGNNVYQSTLKKHLHFIVSIDDKL